MSVHLSKSHPSLYNEKIKEKTKNFLWSEPEFRLLANTILDLKSKKVRDVNQHASKLLGRSSLAIQKIRTKTEYKRIERVIKAELSESSLSSPCVEQSTQFSNITSSVEHTSQQHQTASVELPSSISVTLNKCYKRRAVSATKPYDINMC